VRVERIAWPSGLYAAAFSTGLSASTPELLARVETWREEDEESFEACIGPLAAETLTFIEAFRSHDVRAILDAAAQVQEELATMDRIGDLGILAGGQLQLLGAIEDHGGIGRTSGAGGGDCAWALTDDPARLEAISKTLESLGFARQTPADADLGSAGASVGESG
jgi:phosphomevalonate kinase